MAPVLPEWINVVAEEAHAIALSMLHEKGRSAVLVGAALTPPSNRESLFHPDRPLGSFGARSVMAQHLG